MIQVKTIEEEDDAGTVYTDLVRQAMERGREYIAHDPLHGMVPFSVVVRDEDSNLVIEVTFSPTIPQAKAVRLPAVFH